MPTALDKLYELHLIARRERAIEALHPLVRERPEIALDFGHLIKEAGTFATVRDHDSARGAMVIATTVRT
jgi:hypothetical protein